MAGSPILWLHDCLNSHTHTHTPRTMHRLPQRRWRHDLGHRVFQGGSDGSDGPQIPSPGPVRPIPKTTSSPSKVRAWAWQADKLPPPSGPFHLGIQHANGRFREQKSTHTHRLTATHSIWLTGTHKSLWLLARRPAPGKRSWEAC